MQNLIVNATPKSLEIKCTEGLIEIKGCSIVNDPKVFFKPIQNWVANYIKKPSDDTIINIKIEYIDSASTKFIFEILKSFEELITRNKKVHINWHYDLNDPEIMEIGEILDGRIKIPFSFIQF